MAVGTRADVGKALQTLRAFNKKAEKLEKFQFTKHVAKHGLEVWPKSCGSAHECARQ